MMMIIRPNSIIYNDGCSHQSDVTVHLPLGEMDNMRFSWVGCHDKEDIGIPDAVSRNTNTIYFRTYTNLCPHFLLFKDVNS